MYILTSLLALNTKEILTFMRIFIETFFVMSRQGEWLVPITEGVAGECMADAQQDAHSNMDKS